jgi:zeaxanthin glucosyltransferase
VRSLGARGDESAFPWEQLPANRPLVLVSFGSHLSHEPAVYEALWNAFSAQEAFFVASMRSSFRPATLPAHVLAVDYLPQLALLDRAAAFVNHGGANSVTEAIDHGCPQLVIPIAYDQFVFGRLVEGCGVGRTLTTEVLSVERIRAALSELMLPEAPQRRRAREIASPRVDGTQRAVELLLQLGSA